MWGIRIIVSNKLQTRILQEVHQEHQGIAKMKSIARNYVWWPNLDHCLEKVAKNCLACQQIKNVPAVAPLQPWVWPSKPWQRIHIDFAGLLKGKMYLIVVDAYSKWPEVTVMNSTSAAPTIQALRNLFTRFVSYSCGCPLQLARGDRNEKHFCSTYNSSTAKPICKIWVTRTNCFR